MTFMVVGPIRVIQWHFQHKRQRGEKVILRSPYAPAGAVPADQLAQIAPHINGPARKSKLMKRESYPKPEYHFAFRRVPLSGNVINGLGETTKRQPTPILFHVTGQDSQGWDTLDQYLRIKNTTLRVLRLMVHMLWIGRESTGPIAPIQQPIADPAEMTTQVKATARDLGAILVGVTELKPTQTFEGSDVPYRYAISCAVPMDREEMLLAPSAATAGAIFDAYTEAAVVSTELAKRIRALGWGAVSTSTVMDKAEIAHVPIAIAAGLGQLGKHGSIITKEYGSNVRLGTVLTNLPLVVDEPLDIGVDDFCANCQICTTNCPPQAIFDTKQMVRGEEKWFVNFDACFPYFASNHSCAICIEVCPWSEEGRGASISQKMLEKRPQPST
ncbi:MAG: Epoxyqueuosine reductase QueG (queuosine biosynthesis) [Chloroflexi bacterium AL-W]|nr:Epoxyqueuosine reductase QueG (queuosine biosynthesis) [Chloroflexi bacterium AL-N1]NOK68306.1 Epoxyqueuosine reductase QueG (queuosine biosynthesis) [Chloroflexi bacterium AL-N10]NOK73952.1 Epoxyqueuosine reductase QueG (queuosine biosynthesis) [Chloroflexi bacterium AL-N5]NOK82920.1 Epoxyqueuosine reductase QueG (queuosine biosynthesis) [Chloroflexi bacterium AL-W]NOK90442.1 Epoxyqueuosine reductase QueG (queuosine biosynthesis) [Chloroflexi bacterium AL-N15]